MVCMRQNRDINRSWWTQLEQWKNCWFFRPWKFSRKSSTPGSSTPAYRWVGVHILRWFPVHCVSIVEWWRRWRLPIGPSLAGPGMARCSHRFRQSLADSARPPFWMTLGSIRGVRKKIPVPPSYSSRQHLPSVGFNAQQSFVMWDQPPTCTAMIPSSCFLVCVQVIKKIPIPIALLPLALCNPVPTPQTHSINTTMHLALLKDSRFVSSATTHPARDEEIGIFEFMSTPSPIIAAQFYSHPFIHTTILWRSNYSMGFHFPLFSVSSSVL